MLYAKPLENNFQVNQRFAKCAQDLIQCWKSIDEDSRCRVVANLSKKYGTHSNVFDLEVALMVLQQKIDGDFKNYL